MDTALFDYQLPADLIAQFPAAERVASRLLRVPADDAGGFGSAETRFSGVTDLLKPGDVLVANDTRVVPARLLARKPTGGQVEIMLERMLGARMALAQLRSNKPIRLRQRLLVDPASSQSSGQSTEQATLLVAARRDGFFVVERCDGDGDLAALFRARGAMPLPPYIARAAEARDSARYQTVYSRVSGAVAAPTAGLHFDHALIERARGAGIHWATITLHVGAGTYQPVRAAEAEAHHMHREWVEINQPTCDLINRAKARGGRVIAVGTTVVRALESAARCYKEGHADEHPAGQIAAFSGDTELFILPGYRFRAVDALITNFHLPRSTLLMLVCAFAGVDKIMRAYRHAIEHGYRFYSYGDAMWVERAAGEPAAELAQL